MFTTDHSAFSSTIRIFSLAPNIDYYDYPVFLFARFRS